MGTGTRKEEQRRERHTVEDNLFAAVDAVAVLAGELPRDDLAARRHGSALADGDGEELLVNTDGEGEGKEKRG